MNKTEELKSYMEEVKQRIAEIEAQIQQMEKEDYDVFLLCGDGDTTSVQYSRAKDVCNRYIDRGRAFFTREEAEFQDERDKVFAELLRLGGKYYTKRDYTVKHCLEYRKNGMRARSWKSPSAASRMWFETSEEATNAMHIIGEDRLKKYYFRLAA